VRLKNPFTIAQSGSLYEHLSHAEGCLGDVLRAAVQSMGDAAYSCGFLQPLVAAYVAIDQLKTQLADRPRGCTDFPIGKPVNSGRPWN
jgi:hypothetical protein